MSLDFSAGNEGVDNAAPNTSDDEDGRSKAINVTILRKTCINTGESVLRFITGHKFSGHNEPLGDNVIRTQVCAKTFLLLHVPKYREDLIRNILISNP